jgi:hypothetical protein
LGHATIISLRVTARGSGRIGGYRSFGSSRSGPGIGPWAAREGDPSGTDHASRASRLHRLAEVRPGAHERMRAEGACGFVSPEFSRAGLVEAYIDAHVAMERSRGLNIDAALLQVQSIAARSHGRLTQATRCRGWGEVTRSACYG